MGLSFDLYYLTSAVGIVYICVYISVASFSWRSVWRYIGLALFSQTIRTGLFETWCSDHKMVRLLFFFASPA